MAGSSAPRSHSARSDVLSACAQLATVGGGAGPAFIRSKRLEGTLDEW